MASQKFSTRALDADLTPDELAAEMDRLRAEHGLDDGPARPRVIACRACGLRLVAVGVPRANQATPQCPRCEEPLEVGA